ncbi:hypothetical protein GE061_006625 [Apolygus lucorum]|uniref:DUF4794 domain-containing protein n=1 Tax=Apolygus lucorum TaxID=248454 RepID=A0A8S9WUB8_APOLU|nr:hypothetical protein GE061_006625 [Apolygus lucorum]
MKSSVLLVSLVLAAAGFGAAAPLRLLRIRNMTFLFVEAPDGESVDVLYAPSGERIATLPIGRVDDGMETGPGIDTGPEAEEEFDPELDEPRTSTGNVDSSGDKKHDDVTRSSAKIDQDLIPAMILRQTLARRPTVRSMRSIVPELGTKRL